MASPMERRKPIIFPRPEWMRPAPRRAHRDDEGHVVVSIDSVRRGVATLRDTSTRVVR